MDAVFVPTSSLDFELCHPRRDDDFETIDSLIDGTPRRAMWSPIEVSLVRIDEGRRLAESDAPWLGSQSLIFRPAVLDHLSGVLINHGELLPLACSDADLSVYNPRAVDALDESASDIMRFDDGRIMDIAGYVFKPDVIDGLDVFKLANLRASPTFVSPRFVDRWNKAGLRGLQFDKVWSN